MTINSYRLNSKEEPTDEILQQLMEKVAESARKSSIQARAELNRRMAEIVNLGHEKRKAIESKEHGK
jgi:hypothetical protein